MKWFERFERGEIAGSFTWSLESIRHVLNVWCLFDVSVESNIDGKCNGNISEHRDDARDRTPWWELSWSRERERNDRKWHFTKLELLKKSQSLKSILSLLEMRWRNDKPIMWQNWWREKKEIYIKIEWKSQEWT
jgi:hypothetical protein